RWTWGGDVLRTGDACVARSAALTLAGDAGVAPTMDGMPSPRFILALDQGTTSSRAVLFDQNARPVRIARRPVTQHFPQPGRVHATDVTNASRTLLYDLHAGRWSDAMLSRFGVPAAVLPEVRPSSGDFGTVDAEWLGGPLPITGVAGDQQAALFGQACTAPG